MFNVRDTLVFQRLRSDVDREVLSVSVHNFIKKTAVAANANCQTDDEIRLHGETVDREDLRKAVNHILWQGILIILAWV